MAESSKKVEQKNLSLEVKIANIQQGILKINRKPNQEVDYGTKYKYADLPMMWEWATPLTFEQKICIFFRMAPVLDENGKETPIITRQERKVHVSDKFSKITREEIRIEYLAVFWVKMVIIDLESGEKLVFKMLASDIDTNPSYAVRCAITYAKRGLMTDVLGIVVSEETMEERKIRLAKKNTFLNSDSPNWENKTKTAPVNENAQNPNLRGDEKPPQPIQAPVKVTSPKTAPVGATSIVGKPPSEWPDETATKSAVAEDGIYWEE